MIACVTPPGGAFIDSEWFRCTGSSRLVNPATEEVFAEVGRASAADVDRAVASAKRALDHGPWPRMSLAERWAILVRAQVLLREVRAEIARLQTIQMGAPISRSHQIVDVAADMFDEYYLATQQLTLAFLRRDAGGHALIRRYPVGVVAAIAPWNGPLTQACGKILPALLVGCTVVVKPAEETPLETGRLAEILRDAGLPAGVLNVVLGGRDTGERLVGHPDVTKVSFTGSSAAGRHVATICARSFKRVNLELGGKSAAIVLDDVDLADAVPVIASGNFTNAGQVCVALSRVLVPRSRHDELVDALTEAASRYVLGDPLDPTTTMGPLVAARQREIVESYIAGGLEAGATVVCGGSRPRHLSRGFFVEPTIFTGVRTEMALAQEEIFGPVMSVIPYDSDAEAVAIANYSRFGLYGAVFTRDAERGLSIAERVQSGVIGVNSTSFNRTAPFGGVKASGLGRECGIEGVSSYLEYKSIPIPAELARDLQTSGIPNG